MKIEFGRVVGDIKLTDLIKDNFVYFDSLRQGFAYYNLKRHVLERDTFEMNDGTTQTYTLENAPEYIKERYETIQTFQFIIPLDDVGNGTLRATMKAIECMRWIRKAMESGELIHVK